MEKPIQFDINGARGQVYQAGVAAEEIARTFLAANPYSQQSLGSTSNQDAVRAMKSILELMRVFDERSSCLEQEKQLAYLKFVSTMEELTKAAGTFAKELREKGVMNKVCDSLAKLIYGRPEIGGQIQDHISVHVKLMHATWFALEPTQEAQFRP